MSGKATSGSLPKPAPTTKAREKVEDLTGNPLNRQTRSGIVVTAIRGDLKLIIAGNSDVRILVSFRDYPKSRRERMQTKAEARRELKVTPVMAKGRQGALEAVVEKAGDGVYIIRVEPVPDGGKASFTLKLFEGGSSEKVRVLGSRNLSGKTVLAKVLMPEGILWDDDAAFTGTLEDSDSVTKFNSQTGVYWKEYND